MLSSRLPSMLDQIVLNMRTAVNPVAASAEHVQRFWTPEMINQAMALSMAEPELFTETAHNVLIQLAPMQGLHD